MYNIKNIIKKIEQAEVKIEALIKLEACSSKSHLDSVITYRNGGVAGSDDSCVIDVDLYLHAINEQISRTKEGITREKIIMESISLLVQASNDDGE